MERNYENKAVLNQTRNEKTNQGNRVRWLKDKQVEQTISQTDEKSGHKWIQLKEMKTLQ